jgi:hypothetical protein
MADSLSTLALATGGAFLGKFVGPAAESLGKVAWERAQQLGTKATALLSAVGREPQPVEPKLLLPLVQAASLETDETLVDKWAALLANAADPGRYVEVHALYASILQQITHRDALVLEALYYSPVLPRTRPRASSLMVKQLTELTGLSYEQVGFSLDNLLRLRLLTGDPPGKPQMFRIYLNTPSVVTSTALGEGFMLACAVPQQ